MLKGYLFYSLFYHTVRIHVLINYTLLIYYIMLLTTICTHTMEHIYPTPQRTLHFDTLHILFLYCHIGFILVLLHWSYMSHNFLCVYLRLYVLAVNTCDVCYAMIHVHCSK